MTTPIEAVRIEVQDNAGPGLYLLQDDEISYFLQKNNGSVARASLDAAKSILFRLAQQGDENIDVISLNGATDGLLFDPHRYDADGVFIESLYNKIPEKFKFINKDLCYYNYLR